MNLIRITGIPIEEALRKIDQECSVPSSEAHPQNKATIHHSPFTIHHSPFTIHHSPFTIHHSPFTIHHSSFIIRYVASSQHQFGIL
jgi:hypothetical protein